MPPSTTPTGSKPSARKKLNPAHSFLQIPEAAVKPHQTTGEGVVGLAGSWVRAKDLPVAIGSGSSAAAAA